MKETGKKAWIIVWYLMITGLLIALDQWTKQLAVAYLKGQEAIPIIKGVFELSYLENPGMAWGLLSGKRILFLIASVLILALIVYVFYKAPLTRRYRPLRIILAVLSAGAVGNFIDRFIQGYVVDFFSFCLIHFPIFNVADCYVVVSGIAFVIFFLFYYKEEELSALLPGKFREKRESEKNGDKKI